VRDGAGNQVTARGPVLARRAAAALAPRLVPALLSAFDAGEPVGFGPVRIDRPGITAPAVADGSAPRLMAWTDMRRITIDARTRIGIRTVGRGRDFLIDLDGIPNGLFACHIIERGAAGAGVPVEYRQEKRLPPRGLASVTAG
jgi:predicted pyridoxine 5'-phosphate oxidase superfamily flavin-nucleotide-binding protein